jgi:tetratricopeptide (TPR) repeat protein
VNRWSNIAFWVLGAGALGLGLWTIFSLSTIYNELQAAREEVATKDAALEAAQVRLTVERQHFNALKADIHTLDTQLGKLQAANQKLCPNLDTSIATLQQRYLAPSLPGLLQLREQLCGDTRKTLADNLIENKRAAYLSDAVEARLRGNFDQAVKSYQLALDIPDGNQNDRARNQTAYGYALYRLGRYQEARTATQSALQMNPDETNAGINLIKLQCAAGDSAAAVQHAYQDLLGKIAKEPTDACNVATDTELFRICAYAKIAPDKTRNCATAAQ